MARMSTFSMTGGSTAATAFRAFSNRLPKVLMASRIVGLFSASLRIINRQDNGLDAARSSAHIVKWRPSLRRPLWLHRTGTEPGCTGGHGGFIVLMKSMAELAVARDLRNIRSGDADGVRIISMAGMPAFSNISMCSMVTLPFVCILLSASVTGPKGRVGAVAVERHGDRPNPHGLGRFGYLHTTRREILDSPRRIVKSVGRAGHDLRGLRQRLIRGGNVAGHSRHNAGELCSMVSIRPMALSTQLATIWSPFSRSLKIPRPDTRLLSLFAPVWKPLASSSVSKNQCAVICHLSVRFLPACLFHFAVYLFRAPPHPFLHILLHRPGTALFAAIRGSELPMVFLLLHGFFFIARSLISEISTVR